MKKILVTGGAGYVGSILVPKLLNKGYAVAVLDTLFFTDIGLKAVMNNPNLKIIEGDIRDEAALKASTQGAEAVIHLASISNDPSTDLNPRLTEEVNLEATLKLVKIAKQNGVKRFINASTSSVYGIKEAPNVTEDLPLDPLTVYSRTKAEAEPFVTAANDKNFTTVNIRPATVCGYSPKMRLDLTVNILTMHALTQGKITVFGGGQKRPNIHIEDISGKHVTIEAPPTNDNRSYHISSAKIERELGLKPNKTIRDAVLDVKVAREKGLLDWDDPNFYN